MEQKGGRRKFYSMKLQLWLFELNLFQEASEKESGGTTFMEIIQVENLSDTDSTQRYTETYSF